jgi:hypothetical protein
VVVGGRSVLRFGLTTRRQLVASGQHLDEAEAKPKEIRWRE